MRVLLKDITKKFGELKAIDNASLTIEEGDFFTLLGPSGCGKTTLLRTVAGFYSPDEGTVTFGERIINDIPAHKRETGMVFQNYALFPHLSVFDNVAYGLRARKVSSGDIKSKVINILKSVQLEGLEDRYPSQLSGGQQQRVALARALVISPSVLLMDEPLSNLDAKLRVSMREEIKKIQKMLGITTIYVTHDQEEAMAVSDRIAIINKGKIVQIGTPYDIYFKPKSRFVAEFMGSSNILDGEVDHYDDEKALLSAKIDGKAVQVRIDNPGTTHITLSLRPEWIRLVDEQSLSGPNVFEGEVISATFLGSMLRYTVSGLSQQPIAVEIHDPQKTVIKQPGDTVFFQFDPDRPVLLEN